MDTSNQIRPGQAGMTRREALRLGAAGAAGMAFAPSFPSARALNMLSLKHCSTTPSGTTFPTARKSS